MEEANLEKVKFTLFHKKSALFYPGSQEEKYFIPPWVRGEYFPENSKLFPDENDKKWVTFPNLLSKLSKKGDLFPDEYPRIM